jgi:phenol 2-monooxygenase
LGPSQQKDITSTYLEANADYVVDVFILHNSPHLQVELELLPKPFSDKWTARVYEDVDGKGHARARFRKKTAPWFLSDLMDM